MTGTVKFLSLTILALLLPALAAGEAIPVELRQTDSGWQIFRDGAPYFIRGAGGTHSLRQLKAAGANSIRTWAADDIHALLDEAHSLGLSVAVGIWLGHERHGFDYSDREQVAQQYQQARETILRYKDHPAVLLWGIGNEMEGFEAGDNRLIWQAVNDIAAMAKQLDPAHPTMTVTAEIGGARVAAVHEQCPAIDIHGINSYGGAMSLPKRLREAGASKPYILTEFGPPGSWETGETEWGAPIEPTSTEKAALYRENYQHAVAEQIGHALGAYAFNWGFKMEATATWFGMFLPDGSRLGSVDAMTELWSGKPPSNRTPTAEPLFVAGQSEVDPGEEVRVRAGLSDPEGEPLRTEWYLRPESGEYLTGGDFRRDMPNINEAVLEGNAEGARIRMPDEPGPYRLFVYAYDGSGGAATANVPLLVKGEARTRMPVVVYEDGIEGMPWAPSGWMGAVDKLTLDGSNTDDPYSGNAALKLRYEGQFGWVGVAWQHPVNNWGDRDGGFDLVGASALEVWARGAYGGEKIKIGVGLLGPETTYPDSAIASLEDIVLTSEWQKYFVPLQGHDLTSIKTGFVVAITGRSSPVTVYLDQIRFVR
jgi:Glycosyl hydrolases family 2, TIM barrel domain